MKSNDDPITQIVTIDGPAGAGKSTVARRAALELGAAYLDTGAMYRAATWWALNQGVDMEDGAALAASTRAMDLHMEDDRGVLHVRVGGQDVSEAIREPEITEAIRKLDGIPAVRKHLAAAQRELGARRLTVAEGRDMGTVVFPDARCKLFLDASLDIRAQRRLKELQDKGLKASLQTVQRQIQERDTSDRTRTFAPLRPAPDAILIDTTQMSLDDVVNAIVEKAQATLCP